MPALQILSTVLGSGMSSRLFQKMRDQLGICYYVRSGINDLTDHGSFVVSAGVDSKRVEEAINGILEELKKIRDEKVSEEELKKAKDYALGNLYLGLESSSDLANFYGFQEIFKKDIKTPKDIEKEINKITASDIQKVAKQIITNNKLNLALVGRYKDEEKFKKILSV
jgi:predicted Zn-dependent peptidase